MADCLSDRRIRAIAEYDSDELMPNEAIDLNSLGQGSILAITITPDDGERYQSIVPIEHASLAECLQDYFARSEQLPSLFRFLSDAEQAVGISVHALPMEKVKDQHQTEQHFERIQMLLNTLEADEALSIDAQQILIRLFHEESCRLFDAHPVEFGCVCSAEKSLDAVRSLGQEDVDGLIAEQSDQGNQSLVVDCHFCFQRYEFNFEQLRGLFA